MTDDQIIAAIGEHRLWLYEVQRALDYHEKDLASRLKALQQEGRLTRESKGIWKLSVSERARRRGEPQPERPRAMRDLPAPAYSSTCVGWWGPAGRQY